MDHHENSFIDQASIYLDAGLCVLPAIRRESEKRVALPYWKAYQTRLPTSDELEMWFGDESSVSAMCLVCGAVSGHLEMIDFDNWEGGGREAFEAWRDGVKASVPGLFERLVIETTPSGGRHVVYRCETPVAGNSKLAQRHINLDDVENSGDPVVIGSKEYSPRRQADGSYGITFTIIETRGEGGVFLCDPSPDYRVIQGTLSAPPIVTGNDRGVLLRCARELDETPQCAVDAGASHTGTTAAQNSCPFRPGDDFNDRGDPRDVLIRHKWKLVRTGENEYWRRPNKQEGTSATLKDRVFYVFSSNAPPFEPNTGYPPFSVYALLDHHGDFTAAASALAKAGYGDRGSVSGSQLSAPPIAAWNSPGPSHNDSPVSGDNCAALKNQDSEFTWNPSQQERSHSATFPPTGIGNAKRFVAMFGHDTKYCLGLQRWFIWDTNRWMSNTIRVEGLAKISAEEVTDEKHARYTCSRRGIDEILFLARSEPNMSVQARQFDADPWLFNCQSGTINLRTGNLHPHARNQLLSRISPASFSPECESPRWIGFLRTVLGGDEELVGYIQRVCGYMLTGDVREQCLFFMHGDGCNGKSVFASILQFILGEYARKIPAQTLSRTDRTAGEGPTPFLTTLMRARLVTSSELEEGQKFAEARIKDLTGGDRITARGLRQDPVEFDPTHKLLLYGNHKPDITGTDHGIWRRIHLIPFLVTIPESRRDPLLLDKLKAESGAILAWMARGCLDWQRCGLSPPDAVTHATGGYRAESDPVGRFLDEICNQADGVFVMKGQLHDEYLRWSDGGEEHISKGMFGKRLKRRGIQEKRTHAGWMWIGLELANREGGTDA